MSCGVHSRGALYPTDGRVHSRACRTSLSMFPRHNDTAKETLRNGMPKSQPFLACILSGLLGLSFYTSVLSYAYPFRFVLQQHNAPPSLASLPHLTASKQNVSSIQAYAVQIEDCSTTVLRSTNILLGLVCLYLLCAVYKALHPDASWQTCTQTVSHRLQACALRSWSQHSRYPDRKDLPV